MGIASLSRERCVSYSVGLPPINTPTCWPTTECFGMPALSKASNVHSSRSLCCGSTAEIKKSYHQHVNCNDEKGRDGREEGEKAGLRALDSLAMASFSVREKKGASKAAKSSSKK